MSRIRFMSPYLKGGRDSTKRSNRVRYLATRPGVEVLPDERGDLPATKKQQDYIRRLLRDFPESRELLEYEDYLTQPTQPNASERIQQVHEEYVAAMSQAAGETRPLGCQWEGGKSLSGHPGGGGAPRQRLDAGGGHPPGGRGTAGIYYCRRLAGIGSILRL